MSDYEEEDEGGFIEIDEEAEQNFDDFFEEFGEVNEDDLEEEENVEVNEDEDEDWYDWMFDWFEFSEEEEEEIAEEIVSGIYWNIDDYQEEEEEQPEALYSTQAPRLGVFVPGPGAGPVGIAAALNVMKGAVLQFKEYLESPIGKEKKEKIKGRLGGLKSVFEGAAAMATVYTFFSSGVDKTSEEQLEELKKIVADLEKLDSTIQSGFKRLISHDDFIHFRERVMEPTEELNRLYKKAYSFDMGGSEHPVEEFIEACKRTSPGTILSRLSVYLAENSIILTHLEADNYVYETMKQWENTVHNIADKLSIFNFTYYSLINKNTPSDEAKAAVAGELRFLNQECDARKKRLAEIEEERLKKFTASGSCAKELQKAFDEVKGDYPGLNADWLSYLGKAAERLRDKWKTINGPSNFYVSVVRGFVRGGSDKLAVISEYHV